MFVAVKDDYNSYQIINSQTNMAIGKRLTNGRAEAIVDALNAKDISYIQFAAKAAELAYNRGYYLCAEIIMVDPYLANSHIQIADLEKELAQKLYDWLSQQ